MNPSTAVMAGERNCVSKVSDTTKQPKSTLAFLRIKREALDMIS